MNENSSIMSFSRHKKDEILDFIYEKVHGIIYDNFDKIQDMKNYRLRPGYGYNRFYINKVEGKCSLQSLIHHILFEDQVYKDILSDYQYNGCSEVIKNQPYGIYYPEGDSVEDTEVKELLYYLYNRSLFMIAQHLILNGIDVRYDFRKYLKMYPGEGL